jgi:hypothetical protein
VSQDVPQGFYVIGGAVMAVLGLVLLPRNWKKPTVTENVFPRLTRAMLPNRLGWAAAALAVAFLWLGDRGKISPGLALMLFALSVIALVACVLLFVSVNNSGRPRWLVPPRFRHRHGPPRARRNGGRGHAHKR